MLFLLEFFQITHILFIVFVCVSLSLALLSDQMVCQFFTCKLHHFRLHPVLKLCSKWKQKKSLDEHVGKLVSLLRILNLIIGLPPREYGRLIPSVRLFNP